MTERGPSFGAVITWFHPDEAALQGLEDAAQACSRVIVVDNTPLGAWPTGHHIPDEVVYIANGQNLGLAAALNLGVSMMPSGVDMLLLLDQDSRLPANMLPALMRHLRPEVAIVAPAPWDAFEGRFLDPRTSARSRVAEMNVVITSGMLIRRSALESVGAFREDFFVDSVDQDLCLRLRSKGWKLLQDREVRLNHRLGATRWHSVLGVQFRASHHQASRLYGAARNSTILSREHLRSNPRWVAVNILQMTYWLFTILFFEPPRRQRALLFLRGVHDGLVGGHYVRNIAQEPDRPLR